MYHDWTQKDLFSKDGLEAWHQFEVGISGNEIIYDRSGFDRHISTSAENSPVLIGNVTNGQPVWFFNGSRTPLVYSGNLTVKHLFVVGAIHNANFTNYNGLLTAPTIYPLLIGNNNNSTVFYDLNNLGINNYTYRKSDVSFPANLQSAPFNGKLAILEMQFPDGLNINGIQIGQDRADATRKLTGYFAENMMFSVIRNEAQRMKIYRYFAMRYHLWRKKSDGLNIFPFQFQRSTPFNKTELAEISEAEGNRGRDRVIRYLADEAIGSYDFRFQLRRTIELKAADKFCAEHRLHIPFWVEDAEREQERKIVRDGVEFGNQPSGYDLQSYGFTGKDY